MTISENILFILGLTTGCICGIIIELFIHNFSYWLAEKLGFKRRSE